MSSDWISIKDEKPCNGQFTKVRVRTCILWKDEKEAYYVNGYFSYKGEDITKWVTHWQPSLELFNAD